ncbi:hypothetical protein [Paraburkholderia acidipaludis]|uniref:hypothetical protein n=1 Tax=Paraburkholderia acidipaludis TaxID=660537 RepID=UPI0004820DE7|nr:hypothetical protein [Paraburkholderia acidipaludis]
MSKAAVKRTANAMSETDSLVLFDTRLASENIRLSKREYESCRHYLRDISRSCRQDNAHYIKLS